MARSVWRSKQSVECQVEPFHRFRTLSSVMKMTYEELIDELHSLEPDQLVDIAELAQRFAIEARRRQMRIEGEEAMRDYASGKILPATDDLDELKRRLRDVQ